MINKVMKENRGSFAIEGAIILPLVMVIIFAFIWQLLIIRTEMIYKTLVVKETEKSSLYGYVYEYSDILYSELTQKYINEDIYEVAFTNIYEEIFINNLENNINNFLLNNKSIRMHIKKHNINIEKDLFNEGIYLTSKYTVLTPLGEKTKFYTIPLRLWAYGDNSGKSDHEEIQNVWEMDNFQRGRVVRRRFGGNLPFGFPVISSFQNNCALIIKSMDLNKPTWSIVSNVENKLKYDIDKLINYHGTKGPWGKDQINIREYDIHQKYIKFIFPEDIDYNKYANIFENIKNYAYRNNVLIEIIFYQNSICNNNEQTS